MQYLEIRISYLYLIFINYNMHTQEGFPLRSFSWATLNNYIVILLNVSLHLICKITIKFLKSSDISRYHIKTFNNFKFLLLWIYII